MNKEEMKVAHKEGLTTKIKVTSAVWKSFSYGKDDVNQKHALQCFTTVDTILSDRTSAANPDLSAIKDTS